MYGLNYQLTVYMLVNVFKNRINKYLVKYCYILLNLSFVKLFCAGGAGRFGT